MILIKIDKEKILIIDKDVDVIDSCFSIMACGKTGT